MKRYLLLTIAVLTVVGCTGTPDRPVPLPEMPALGEPVPLPADPHRQFDFWLGEWNVQNKHLRGGSWKDSGTARALIQPVVDGGAILEQWNGVLDGDPLIGFSIRAYDPSLGKWVIYLNWHGGKPGGFSPMHGTRREERMELFPPDDETQTRYTFSLARENSCQWDSANSKDGGKLWVTDWVMQFTRREAPLVADAANLPIRLPPESAADYPETRRLDSLIGSWYGQAQRLGPDGSWDQGTALARVSSMIEGFGLIQFVDTGWGERMFAALGYDTRADSWVAIRADNVSDGLLRLTGQIAEGSVTFASESIRETWSKQNEEIYRFDRAISGDGGVSWETVFSATFERIYEE